MSTCNANLVDPSKSIKRKGRVPQKRNPLQELAIKRQAIQSPKDNTLHFSLPTSGDGSGSEVTDMVDKDSDHKLLIDKMLKKILKDAKEKNTAESKVEWKRNKNEMNERRESEQQVTGRDGIDNWSWVRQVRNNTPKSATAKVEINCKDGNRSIQEVEIMTIPSVKRVPHSTDWTHTAYNVRGEDTTEITHFPTIYDPHSTKQIKFENKLLEAYGGKFKGDIPTGSRAIEDQPFFMLVNSMAKDSRLGFVTPNSPSDCEELWISLSKATDGGGTELELKTRFEAIQREENPAKVIQNLDSPADDESVDQSKDATMDSFATIFCRRCFVYDCKRHDEQDTLDSKCYSEQLARSEEKDVELTCKHGNKCWKAQKVIQVREKEIVLAEWKDLKEVSEVRCHWETFEKQYCWISYLLKTKTCMQVCELAVHRKWNSDDDKVVDGSPSSDFSTSPVSHEPLPAVVTKHIKQKPTPRKNYFTHRYLPCKHPNELNCDKNNLNCVCGQSGSTCEKYCFCAAVCPNRFKGCKCKVGNCGPKTSCSCFAASRECDPDVCKSSCGADKFELASRGCGNVAMQRLYQPNSLKVDESGVHKGGFGLFILNDVMEGEFIVEYCGEMISNEEATRRQVLYDAKNHTFLFTLDDYWVLDSTKIGNVARFINSSKSPNTVPKVLFVNGDHRIGIFAKQDIVAGEELLFDYHHLIKEKPSCTKSKRTASSTSTS